MFICVAVIPSSATFTPDAPTDNVPPSASTVTVAPAEPSNVKSAIPFPSTNELVKLAACTPVNPEPSPTNDPVKDPVNWLVAKLPIDVASAAVSTPPSLMLIVLAALPLYVIPVFNCNVSSSTVKSSRLVPRDLPLIVEFAKDVFGIASSPKVSVSFTASADILRPCPDEDANVNSP